MISDKLVAVLTGQAALRDQVLAMAATAGLVGEVVDDVDELLQVWHRARLIVIGTDRAAAVTAVAPGRRRDVYLLGADADTDELARWSGPLGAVVVPLPAGAPVFAQALARTGTGGSGSRDVVAVIGGTGGAGASTTAAAITFAARRRSLTCALVDLDPVGGGLDLLMGAEHRPGWRWPQLLGAGGNLPDLGHELIDLDGAGLLSMDRWAHRPPTSLQIEAVLDAAVRDHALTVVDLPRAGLVGLDAVVRRSSLLVVVARADVRSFAATSQVLGLLPEPTRLAVVVRGPGLDASTYAERLGGQLLGVVADDRQVSRDVACGLAPGRRPRSKLARAADGAIELVCSIGGPTRDGVAA